MITFLKPHNDARQQELGKNLLCAMSRSGLSIAATAAATGVDYRTVHGILKGRSKPQVTTLHKLAAGLGVDVGELLAGNGSQCDFDRASNPAVSSALEKQPKLFAKWSRPDFEELFSRVAVGGPITEEGVIQIAQKMNRRRELLKHVMVILETDQMQLFDDICSAFFRDVQRT